MRPPLPVHDGLDIFGSASHCDPRRGTIEAGVHSSGFHLSHRNSRVLRKRGTGGCTKVSKEQLLPVRLLGRPEASFEGQSLRFGSEKVLALLCHLVAELL